VNVFPNGPNEPIAALVMVCLAVVGFIVLGRLWPWYPIAFVSAWLVAAVASLAGWPMAPDRMNVPILWMFHTAAVVAVVYVLARFVRNAALVACAGAVLLFAFWPAPPPDVPEAFARGLTSDFDIVASSPNTLNIVVSYHPMSHWYADDRLINDYRGRDSFSIIREPPNDASPLYDDLTEVVRVAGWAPGTAVWCVVPFEVGPAAGSRACRLGLPGLAELVHVRGRRADIIGWLPAPAGAYDGGR
jgi:hypothetical protein